MVEFINATPGLSCLPPAGAFYIFANCQRMIGRTSAAGTILTTDEDVAGALLDEAGIATVHGSAFGLPGYLRIGFSYSDAMMAEARTLIRNFCEGVH
jgi:aspartate aminotransferase